MNQIILLQPQVFRRQRGVSLLVVLILLIVMSLLGIAVLRSSAMQERMSANMVDRNEAMQAAEAGLLAGQNVILTTYNGMWDGSAEFATLRSNAGQTCANNGICDRSNRANASTWQAAPDPPSAAGAWTTMPNNARYWFSIEYLGEATGEPDEAVGICTTSNPPAYLCQRPAFRITSYGRGRGVAEVVLQSNVISRAR